MVKRVFARILCRKNTSLFISCFLVLVSFCLLFPSGICHSSSVTERSADYLANVAERHTVNNKYVGLMIEPNDSSSSAIIDPVSEFLDLYGVFREQYATYVSAYNSNRDQTIVIGETGLETNFSFFNIDRGYGTEPYKGHYKAITYPLELMFESHHPYIAGRSFIYVSQSCADLLLDKDGKEHNEENYKSLIYSDLTLYIDGKRYNYYIDNIYLEINYFYEALNEVIGDFLVGGYPKDVSKKQAVFFLRNQTFQNIFFLNYVASNYPAIDFDYKILDYNFTDDFNINYERIVISPSNSQNYFSFTFLSLVIAALIATLLYMLFGDYDFSIKKSLVFLLCSIFPYIIFKIIQLITKDTLLFSQFSTMSYMWCLLGFVIIYVLFGIYKKYFNKVKSR